MGKSGWRATPLHLLWTIWNEKNKLVFGDDWLSIQGLKFLFLSSFWSKTKLSTNVYRSSLISFVD